MNCSNVTSALFFFPCSETFRRLSGRNGRRWAALMATTREIYVRERIASGFGWIIRMVLGEHFNRSIVLLSVKRKMNVPFACVNMLCEYWNFISKNLRTFAHPDAENIFTGGFYRINFKKYHKKYEKRRQSKHKTFQSFSDVFLIIP